MSTPTKWRCGRLWGERPIWRRDTEWLASLLAASCMTQLAAAPKAWVAHLRPAAPQQRPLRPKMQNWKQFLGCWFLLQLISFANLFLNKRVLIGHPVWILLESCAPQQSPFKQRRVWDAVHREWNFKCHPCFVATFYSRSRLTETHPPDQQFLNWIIVKLWIVHNAAKFSNPYMIYLIHKQPIKFMTHL